MSDAGTDAKRPAAVGGALLVVAAVVVAVSTPSERWLLLYGALFVAILVLLCAWVVVRFLFGGT